MPSNIEGNVLTLEEKITRRVQATYAALEDANKDQIKAFINRRYTNFEIIELISDALEEMFAP